MPISTEHPSYIKYADKWGRTRDTFEGTDDVKGKGKKYLPRLDAQNNEEYEAYKTRAVYFDGVERTVRGLVGAVMRISPIIEAPDKLTDLFSDITLTGTSLNSLIAIMLKEQILMARQGLLVDFTDRPYVVQYLTEQITNWFDDTIVLRESYKVESDDVYEVSYETQYRELTLKDDVYITNIWKKDTKEKDTWVKSEPLIATIKGTSLDHIPFIGISTDGFNLEPSKSSILSLADVALSLYRTSADLEHGRHYTALPTPYVTGTTTEQAAGINLKIGPSAVWMLPEVQAKAGFIEFTGQGLKALEVGMVEKKAMMVALGSQLLQSKKAGVEASETVRLRQNAEASTLMNAVKLVEQAITQVLVQMNQWLGGTDKITVKLNTDFVDSKMSPQDITALMSAWQSGAISHDTFLYNLKRGEILEEGIDVQTEKDKISIDAID